jgi:hypothetical protein
MVSGLMQIAVEAAACRYCGSVKCSMYRACVCQLTWFRLSHQVELWQLRTSCTPGAWCDVTCARPHIASCCVCHLLLLLLLLLLFLGFPLLVLLLLLGCGCQCRCQV